MIDLGHRLAQRHQPGAGAQGAAHLFLHPIQLLLHPADLVATAGGGDGGGRLGVGAEPLDRGRHPPHRRQHQIGQGGVEGRARHHRDQQRQQKALQQKVAQLGLQRPYRGDHLDEVAGAIARPGHDPDRPVVRTQQRPPRIQGPGHPVGLSQVDEIWRAAEHGRLQQQAAHALFADRHGLDAADLQKLPGRVVLDLGIGQGLDPYRCGLGDANPVQQPTLVKGSGRRRNDQSLYRHGEDRR